MSSGRIRRSARRGIAAAVLGWLGVAAASVFMAPSAAAAPAVTVPVRDVTQLVVSVDKGGAVTFTNEIQNKTIQVGGGGLLPSLVNVTARTDVTLRLPSGAKPLQPGQSVTEKFGSSCLTECGVSFAYRFESGTSLTRALTDAALAQLPVLVPQPLVVNTLVPLPNLPGTNLPQLPPVTVQVPPLTTPTPPAAGAPGTPQAGGPGSPQQSGGLPPIQGIDGPQYTYDTGAGAVQMAPALRSAAAAFDPSRFAVPGDRRDATGGAGGLPGTYDGASVPVFGQLAGLDGTGANGDNAQEVAATSPSRRTLPAAALAAVVVLAAVTAALVRTHQAQRMMR